MITIFRNLALVYVDSELAPCLHGCWGHLKASQGAKSKLELTYSSYLRIGISK